MPYFSFSLNNVYHLSKQKNLNLVFKDLKPNKKYYSKNTNLWNFLNKKEFSSNLDFIKYEKRYPIIGLGNTILFCLPPSIGLGDAVEYALAIKAILLSKRFDSIGVAFVGKYKEIFQRYFNINEIYDEVICEDFINSYETIFHITLEINKLKYQKYNRRDIERMILNYFNVSKFRKSIFLKKTVMKKISIFPISKSPIRTMPIDLINFIVNNFYHEYKIEIILDKNSKISEFIKENISYKKIKILSPNNLKELLTIIENINFGVFMDSGPLHVAKILRKKGILITGSVSAKILLNDFHSINSINNNYKSLFCQAPCGLVNIFNFENKSGCYDSLKINKEKVLNLNDLQSLQRGNLKNNYVNFVANPVNCLKNISNNEVKKLIKETIIN